MITQKELKENFTYDQDTGVFVKFTTKRSRVVGSKTSQGYLAVYFSGRSYLLHRLAWLYIHGVWPKDQIDHINHDREDNRFFNLREVTHKNNGRNAKMPITNTSGHVGVYFRKDSNNWRAIIIVDDKRISLGSFSHKDSAIDARKFAEKKYGFHPNHGR